MGRWRRLKWTEWLMIALIVMLLVGIAFRWRFIRQEVREAVRERFIPPSERGE